MIHTECINMLYLTKNSYEKTHCISCSPERYINKTSSELLDNRKLEKKKCLEKKRFKRVDRLQKKMFKQVFTGSID